MKTKLATGGLLAFLMMTGVSQAQTTTWDNMNANYGFPKTISWYTSNWGSGFGHKIYNDDYSGKTYLKIAGRHNSGTWQDMMTVSSDGLVGIGTTAPSTQLHVATTGATQFLVERTLGQINGLKVFFTSNPATGVGVGSGSTIFQNQATSLSDMLFMPTPNLGAMVIKSGGNVGVGTTSPVEKLSVQTSGFNDGISITQTGSDACAMHMYNNSTGGQHWALFSTGSGNTQGAGHFSIFQYGAADRLFINGSSGNVGISTISPGYAKLRVVNENPLIPSGIGGTRWGIFGSIEPKEPKISDGIDENDVGVEGNATTSFMGQQILYGVIGRGSNGLNNYGGYFEGTLGDPSKVGAANFGVRAKATGNYRSYGVYAEASGAAVQNWAGYFQGDVNINGAAFCTASAWSSDLKLKKDIKPITDGLEKIRLLKPSTYTFKNDKEFKDMNLPKEQQLGLIAQDLEKVFPYLVTELAEDIQKDSEGKIITSIPSHKMVNYIGLIPVLISALQEQDKVSQEQQEMISKQAQINADLQKQLDEQKQLLENMQKNSGTGSPTGIGSTGGAEVVFQMSQNEPNPFSHETTVRYTLPQTVSNAFMAVYDLTGKQITTFPITEKGSSSVIITSEKLAAGIYIYSIVADGKIVDSKRMVVAEK